jgi:hypothetical protein
MLSRSINDTYRVVSMTIIGDATTDDYRGFFYNHNIFIIQTTGLIISDKARCLYLGGKL